MTELELLKTEVHAKGFNISMMINTFKKKQVERKALYSVPDEVFCEVCRVYLKKGEIRKDFPYFMTVLIRKSEEFMKKKQTEYEGFGKMADSIKAAIREVVK